MGFGLKITDQDKAEACAVTSKGSGHQFEIQLGHLCNNRCVFCSSGQLTEMKIARHIPLDPMITAIEEARAQGARRITFLGGEPTLHKGFLDALKRSVELGFEEIVIFTNGVLLPHPGFIDKVVALGNHFEWRISVQGGNEAAHVAVTKRKDSFQRIVTGLRTLQERGQRVTANMCVNEESYRSLPDYPALIREHGIRQLHVDIIRPSSTGERDDAYLREIMPRYSTMAPYFAEMLADFERNDPSFDVNVGNLPYCIIPAYAHRIHHGGEETITKASDATSLEVAVDKYEWHKSMRRHLPRCGECAFRPQCTGIFSTYLDLHGDDEFQPVSLTQLASLDPTRRHFTLLVEPHLAALERAQLPAGWARDDWRREARDGIVDARFRDDAGRIVSLRFQAPGRSQTPVAFETNEYALAVTIDPFVEEPALGTLLAWAHGHLAGSPGIVETRPLALLALLKEHRAARLLATGRLQADALVERVEHHARFGAWTVASTRSDTAGRVVELLHADGARIDIVFAVRTQGDRPRVALDARLVAGADAAMARALVDDVVRALQAPSES